jgi:predicted nuclease of restriction endonuclease-like (RecB) superfamily
MTELLSQDSFNVFVRQIKEQIRSAQYEALKKVNATLIALYWQIGQSIVEKQELENWGKSIVETLASELQREFPEMRGFSAQNLWNMRLFYTTYSQNTKLQPLVREIGWTHNTLIFTKCKDPLEQEFYLKMVKKFGWTKNVLIHQLESNAYAQFLSNQTNFDKAVPEQYRHQAILAVKDEYQFDFLDLADVHSERELERGLIENIKSFLTEMGSFFTFVGSQYRLEIDGRNFVIDLLLYHRGLRSLVAVELKIGDFLPEYVGKMQFYLRALDKTVKMEHENPSIGLIICKSKSRTIVEYALHDAHKPIGVATYNVSDTLPEELSRYLPDIAEIERRVNALKGENVGHHD